MAIKKTHHSANSASTKERAMLDFQRVFESSPGLLLILDPELTVLAASDAYLSAANKLRHDVVGHNVLSIFSNDTDDSTVTGVRDMRGSLERVLRTKKFDAQKIRRHDLPHVSAQGTNLLEKYWSSSNSPVLDASGDIIQIMHHVQDVTELVQLKNTGGAALKNFSREIEAADTAREGRAAELLIANKELAFQKGEKVKRAAELNIATTELALRAKLEQTLSYNQAILDTMREPLLILDKSLRIKSANVAFYAMFSISKDDSEGALIYELKNRRWDTPQLREALEKILPQKSTFSDLEITFDLNGQGSKVMLFNGRRLIQSEVGEELILLAMQDITEQRVLQQRNDSFMSMASHELKTPVTTIKTLIQILQKQYARSTNVMLNEYLMRMGQQVDQLTKLVTDLLDVSKIKADKFELVEDQFDLDTLALEIVKSCQFLSREHNIELRGETLATIGGDRNAIGRVFTNIIVNAIKYAPGTDKIIVTLSHTKRDACVSIQDFGVGIAADHVDKIFQRFFQVGNKNGQSFAGLGIGLYIAEAIMHQHHGRIWVESTEGTGTTFLFTLPIVASIAH